MLRTTHLLTLDEMETAVQQLLLLLASYRDPIDFSGERLCLGALSDSYAIARYRFQPGEIAALCNIMRMPTVVTYANDVCPSEEAMCMTLQRLAYPCRLVDIAQEHSRSICACSRIINHTINFIYEKYHGLLRLSARHTARMPSYCAAVAAKLDGTLNNVWGFVDGTLQTIARPQGALQRDFYSGYKKKHCINWQAVSTPDGMVLLYPPEPGRFNDAGAVASCGLLGDMREFAHSADGEQLLVWGDAGYPTNDCIIGYYRHPTEAQRRVNELLGSVRSSVEYSFHLIKGQRAFVNYYANQKISLQSVGRFFSVAVLLTNIHNCFVHNQISTRFALNPPSIAEYLAL
jgi:hypothetical protein